MKTMLILTACLIVFAMSISIVQANDNQTNDNQTSAESSIVVAELDVRAADSKSLFEGRCQMCHQLPEPDMLNPRQWRLILSTMQQRMQQAGVPQLTDEEADMILEYIEKQSG